MKLGVNSSKGVVRMNSQWMPQINHRMCIGCGDCIASCPTEALGKLNGKANLLQSENCTYCAACEMACPVGAIELPYLIVRNEYREDAHDA